MTNKIQTDYHHKNFIFPRNWGETDRVIVGRKLFIAFLENGYSIYCVVKSLESTPENIECIR